MEELRERSAETENSDGGCNCGSCVCDPVGEIKEESETTYGGSCIKGVRSIFLKKTYDKSVTINEVLGIGLYPFIVTEALGTCVLKLGSVIPCE